MYLEKNLPGLMPMAMQFMVLGTLEDLRRQIIEVTFTRACLGEPWPVDEETFRTRCREAKPRLSLLAQGLARPEITSLLADQLGRRHLCYGMKDEHYKALRKALVRTLAEVLGQEFTPEVRAAWIAAFDMMASLTQEAASKVTSAYCH